MSRLLLKDFRKDPPSSQFGSIQKLSILIILAGAFLMLVVILGWFALSRVEEKIQVDVGDALQIVLQTTQESLNLWVESDKFHMAQLAEDLRLVSLTERQLRVLRNKKALLKSGVLPELRAFFQYRRNRSGQTGFFIISPDFINIASMRDGNIGAKNLIVGQADYRSYPRSRRDGRHHPPASKRLPKISNPDPMLSHRSVNISFKWPKILILKVF
jgi:polar amino acid transport system substrate-binding protein